MNSFRTPEPREEDNPSGMEYPGRHTTSVVRQQMRRIRGLGSMYLLRLEEVLCIGEQHLFDARVEDDR